MLTDRALSGGPPYSTLKVRLATLLCAVCFISAHSSNGQALQIQDPPAALIPSCTAPTYTPIPPPPPDAVQIALNERKRYRLVIGAGENSLDSSMNRSFVDLTAALVDSRLKTLGFLSLPSFANKTPYLAGSAATKQAIMDALNEMVSVTNQHDYGIIYYVGHGSIALSNNDLTLGVYDRPVARDDGIRVSDILGTLEFGDWRSDITEIPHYVLVLDACFSGNAAMMDNVSLRTQNNVQRLQQIQGQIVPDQIAIIAATSDGDSTSAYELKQTNASAFGYYFARGLNEDWSCADAITPDGILTLNELTTYLRDRLKLASDQKYTDALMTPTILNKDMNAFIAYDASKHAIDGLRSEILTLEVQSTQNNQTAVVTLPSGTQFECRGPGPSCKVQVSNKLSGFIEVKSIIAGIPTDEPIKGAGSGFKHTEQTGQVAAQDLLQGNSVSLVGVLLKIDK